MSLTWHLPQSPLALSSDNGGSCIMLASDSDGGPRLRWQLMVDPDGGTGQWLWTIVASDLDGRSWSWWLLNMDYDYNKTAWYIVFLLRYSIITDNNPSIHWPCCKYPSLSDVLLYMWHLFLTCGSLWGFYFLFTLLRFYLVVCPYSCWELRTEDVSPC